MRQLLALAMLAVAGNCLAAGSSMTFTYDDGSDGAGIRTGYRKIIVDWVSDDTAGNVTGTTRKIAGALIKGVTDPGATAPDDNYDIAITDPEGLDVLTPSEGELGNRDTANSEQTYFLIADAAMTPAATAVHPVVCDALTITITNAGNSKTGQLIIYYKSE